MRFIAGCVLVALMSSSAFADEHRSSKHRLRYAGVALFVLAIAPA